MNETQCQALYAQVGERVRRSDHFSEVNATPQALVCRARGVETDASYRVSIDASSGKLYVGLYTPDRWLSESIEADLLHQGDDMNELLDEELCELGCNLSLTIEHFRNEDLEFVFQSEVPVESGRAIDDEAIVDRVQSVLLAFAAVFAELGDMAGQ